MPALSDFASAVAYLDSYISYEKTLPPKYCGESWYQLERFRALLASAGDPQRELKCVHIAGTDGKGSTAVYLATLLKAFGWKTGLYTSPHFVDYTERIRIDGVPIPKQRFAELLSILAERLEAISAAQSNELKLFATVFELLTALAFLYYRDAKVDYAVIETGLGGRLDATNVIDPVLSILTPIHLEHTRFLGKTLARIATEKAGIIKPGRPGLPRRPKPAALEVLRGTSREKGSPLYEFSSLVRMRNATASLEGYRAELKTRDGGWREVRVPLPGFHQLDNLALALLAAQFLMDGCPGRAQPPSRALIDLAEKALPEVRWPGRGEIFREGGRTWILDVAHSIQGARSLRALLDDLFPKLPILFFLGFSGDKSVEAYGRALIRGGDEVFLFRSTHPRAMSVEEARRRVAAAVPAKVSLGGEFAAWLLESFEDQREKEILCVSGSLFWVADARGLLMDRLRRREEAFTNSLRLPPESPHPESSSA
jgi:dihydrofolate synthase/folylpolyglutamate synthase